MFPDIHDADSFGRFLAAPESVLVMTPLWSAFPRPTVEKLSGIFESLATQGLEIFTATEDDPSENPIMAQWISENDGKDVVLLPGIAAGGGCLVVCKSGKPIAIQPSTWQWSADKLADWIQSNRHNKASHSIADRA